MNQPNEFPVRLDLNAVKYIAKHSVDQISNKEMMDMVLLGVNPDEVRTLGVLRMLHQYMITRRIDPGFQVVLGE